jgi:Fic family protein
MPTFLDGFDSDIRAALIAQLRNLWTHTSTALEGNTLTLGETAFVIDEGLTVSGKSLKDHHEVIGHARAIDIVYSLIRRDTPIIEQDLFDLHTAVQTNFVTDILQPSGAWKREPNGTYAIDAQGTQVFIDYAAPRDVPELMRAWLQSLNDHLRIATDADSALTAYVELHVNFVRIHPFCDGNGRMARLLANLPVLRSGSPPIVIPKEKRREYIGLLAAYELATGTATTLAPLLPQPELLTSFRMFCAESWKISTELVEQARREQGKRARPAGK